VPNFISIRSGVLIVWGSNFWLSHKKEKSLLTHGLNYRSACDRIFPRSTPVAMATTFGTIGYSSPCVKDICEIFAFIGGFSEMGH